MHTDSLRAPNASLTRGFRGRHLRSSSRASEHACRAAHHTMLRGVSGALSGGLAQHGAAVSSWLHAISTGEVTGRYAEIGGAGWAAALLLMAALGCVIGNLSHTRRLEQGRGSARPLSGSSRLQNGTSGMVTAGIAWAGFGRPPAALRRPGGMAAWAGTDEDEDEDVSSDHFLLHEADRPAVAEARYGSPGVRGS